MDARSAAGVLEAAVRAWGVSEMISEIALVWKAASEKSGSFSSGGFKKDGFRSVTTSKR